MSTSTAIRRCAALAATCTALHLAGPASSLVGYLKWGLALWTVVEFNSVLNRWAEDRWVWRADHGGWDWNKEIAVVTGGSNGIGACLVQKLVAHGIKVAILDVGPMADSFTNAERALIRYYKCDITSRHAIHTAADAIRSDLGSPSILINNAGIGNAWTILDMPADSLAKLFDINLLSHWSTVQEFLPDMIANKKGHVIGVASLASFVALAGAVDYSCTKAALLAFHEGLTQELKHRYKCPQIKTTIVHPGWTRSAITAHPAIQAGLKRVGASLLEPGDVADAIVKQILAAKSGQIVLGPGLAPKIRALPVWLQELIRDSQSSIVNGNGTTASG